jgi:integrase/recombinase XerD
MANATSAVSPLRRRMIDDMTLRNLSPSHAHNDLISML